MSKAVNDPYRARYTTRDLMIILEQGNWGQFFDSTGINATGYRLLQMLHFAKEMTQPIQEETEEFSGSRIKLIGNAWTDAQPLLPGGSYTSNRSPELDSALAKLLRLRLQPDMQIFFEYLSPSGYINKAKADRASQ